MRINLLVITSFYSLLSFGQGFSKLGSNSTGIEFYNQSIEVGSSAKQREFIQGGGVAIGDIDNDGLEDIYFTGNGASDKLYKNLGDLKFEDVTTKFFPEAKYHNHKGVSMVDVNSDGWLDIYISCAAGKTNSPETSVNKLYINQKGEFFTEEAAKYGLNDSSSSTQSVFFDADGDGDLDVFILNHSQSLEKLVQADDRLMIFESGLFVDRSRQFGISSKSNGSGIIVSDFNYDFLPDIYLSSYFESRDYFFEGFSSEKYRDIVRGRFRRFSFHASGIDAADINNDGKLDIITAGSAHSRSELLSRGSGIKYLDTNSQRVIDQFAFNSLQLNIPGGFLEIANLSGVSRSGLTCTVLLADFDNDGFCDLFITTGTESKNRIFKNNGDLTFVDLTDEWGFHERINVNGSAYADLDLDGDLDLVCNALNDFSFIMQNNSTKNNSVFVKLSGDEKNTSGVGAKINVFCGDKIQNKEVSFSKGYLSSMSQTTHFGIGNKSTVDSIEVWWNNSEKSIVRNIKPNQTVVVECGNKYKGVYQKNEFVKSMNVTKLYGVKSQHRETMFNDFEYQKSLPHKMSELGPFYTVCDFNGDGLDDFFVGSPKGQLSKLFFQNEFGEFTIDTSFIWKQTKEFEDMHSVAFDFDNDGDKDLYLVSGGNEAFDNPEDLRDRLYINDGAGVFTLNAEAVPNLLESGGMVLNNDINSDGLQDLIVFGRQIPNKYPLAPSSRILINTGTKLVDQTEKHAPYFKNLGMVTDAVLFDYDDDKDEDLILVGEWMPVTIFNRDQSGFHHVTGQSGLDSTVGWWNSIDLVNTSSESASFILGNLGENNDYQPLADYPVEIYFTNQGSKDNFEMIMTLKIKDTSYILSGGSTDQNESEESGNDLKSINDAELAKFKRIKLHTFSNSILTIKEGVFSISNLPSIYQTGPITSVTVNDFTKDGKNDFVILGSDIQTRTGEFNYNCSPGYFVSSESGLDNPQLLNLRLNIKSADLIKIRNIMHVILGSSNNGIMALDYY